MAGVQRCVQAIWIVWEDIIMSLCRCVHKSTQGAFSGTDASETPTVRPTGFDVNAGGQDC